MAKRMYADVVMNGVEVNISIRANSEKEARTKLDNLHEYRGVSQILDVSPNPPRNWKDEKEEKGLICRRSAKTRKNHAILYTGGHLHTY